MVYGIFAGLFVDIELNDASVPIPKDCVAGESSNCLDGSIRKSVRASSLKNRY